MEIKRASGTRPKKRKFTGNQHTREKKEKISCSASAKKIKMDAILPPKDDGERLPNFDGYRFFNIDLLCQSIQNSLCCKQCHGNVLLSEEFHRGLYSRFVIKCMNGCAVKKFANTTMVGTGKNVPEINRRFAYAMRTIGQGRAGMETFCCGMDLPPCVAWKSYNCAVTKILSATSDAADSSMRKAAQAEAILSNSSLCVTVSGDGTWKTRGHTSLIGVCAVIGAESGKVIDVEVMSTYSEEMRGVKYTSYIGDGDTKTYLGICNAKPYGPSVEISKIECVGHIQKRMGTRLRKLKTENKSVKLSDGKTLSGKGRLTDKLINEITIYYGNAIREHKDSLSNMRKAIWAIYYHKISTNEKPIHDFCPTDNSTWCKYQRSLKDNVVYRHINSVPEAVMQKIKPIFKELSQTSLLKRCLGGKTQNSNESFNSMIWKFCPKNSGAGRRIVEIATNEATIIFNDGCCGRHDVMDRLELHRSKFSIEGLKQIDDRRIANAERKALDQTKEQRKLKRQNKISNAELSVLAEGDMYAAGSF